VRRRGDDFVAGFAAPIIEFVVSLAHSQLDKFDKKKSSSVPVKGEGLLARASTHPDAADAIPDSG
jgi:hypothetical protein